MEKNLGINLGASSPGMSAADKEQLSNIALDLGQISELQTTNKSSVVDAINEVKNSVCSSISNGTLTI